MFEQNPLLNALGVHQLYGLPLYENINAVNHERIFTKKQTRKFTNTRWVKKYKKNHSYTELIPICFLDNINRCYYAHPSIIRQLNEQHS